MTSKEWKVKNKAKVNKNEKERRKANYLNWKGYFQRLFPKPECEVCGKNLKWTGKISEIVCFDHRHGPNLIPSKKIYTWLQSHVWNEKNIRIWESLDFGILCRKCNGYLPTEGRKKWLRAAVFYTFGKHI